MDKIDSAQSITNTINHNILNEANLWMIIDECTYKQRADFRGALEDYVETTGGKLLRKASLKLDEISNKITVNAVQALDNNIVNYLR
jgi:hypothetical protein